MRLDVTLTERNTMSFTTIEDVMLFLNKEELTDLEVSQVTALISQMDGVIANYCGWAVLATDYVGKKFSGDGTSSEITLSSYPLNSITSVVQDGVEIKDTLEASNEEGILFIADGTTKFTKGLRNIVASYNAGFTAVPSDLVYAASYLVGVHFDRISESTIAVEDEKFNTITVKHASTDLPKLVIRVLDRYRLISIY
jgi:hypothetical protein